MSNYHPKYNDKVTVASGQYANIREHVLYQVLHAGTYTIIVLDDVGIKQTICISHVSPAPVHLGAMGAGQRAKHAWIPKQAATLDSMNTTEQRTIKANQRVTSRGSFEKGDKVVYKDGTPIPLEYGFFRVTRCTASAVWFEHCYSMPFNPTEFKRA